MCVYEATEEEVPGFCEPVVGLMGGGGGGATTHLKFKHIEPPPHNPQSPPQVSSPHSLFEQSLVHVNVNLISSRRS